MPKRIEVKGPIIPSDYQWIYDLFEIEATSPKKVNELIAEANGEELEVIVNSGGGDVFSGSEIYTFLKDYPSNVTVKIVGVAASAASVVAMAGKKVVMSPTAQIMIHNASTVTWGDKREHQHTAEFLKTVDSGIANAYRLKTGLSQSELTTLMNKESWMNAQDALSKGFIDEIMFDGDNQLRAVASSRNDMIPEQVIDRIRNEFAKLKSGGENDMNTGQSVVDNQVTTPPTNQITNPEQVTNNSGNDAVAKERERLKAIDAIAANIDPELVEAAKYGDNPMSAEQLAFQAMKEGKMINSGLFEQSVQANKDAGTENVQAQGQEQQQEKEYDLNNLNDINAVFAQLANSSMAGRQQNIKRG